ncbi:MAG: hypothetical protein A2X84_10060 [Desulfuromonadaceae bacterium GWC2_58_13]|nr:MAG: hypothetical protein A2X84_10060 [Desulfuromonadaceae bacterium GWC2_58_13]
MLHRLTNSRRVVAEQRRRDIQTCPYFFFYGSLMERYENFKRYIKKRVLLIEVAYCRGILYHLPVGFPGLIVPEQGGDELVVGEVMAVSEPEKVMQVLDRLEDYYPAHPRRSVYIRRLLPILVETPGDPPSFRESQAWVYTYPADHLTLRHERQVRIECGQWKAFAKPPRGAQEVDLMALVKQQRYSTEGGRIAIEPSLLREPRVLDKLGSLPCFQFCRNQHRCGYQINSGAEAEPDTLPEST